MKYKVEDKVRVREDLDIGQKYGGVTFARQMDKWKGKLVTISNVCEDSYKINEDDGRNWSDNMFEDGSFLNGHIHIQFDTSKVSDKELEEEFYKRKINRIKPQFIKLDNEINEKQDEYEKLEKELDSVPEEYLERYM